MRIAESVFLFRKLTHTPFTLRVDFILFCSFLIQVLVFTKQSYGKVVLFYKKCVSPERIMYYHHFLGEQGEGRIDRVNRIAVAVWS